MNRPKILIESESGRKELHVVLGIKWNTWNEIVPIEIETCCGKYIPTSGADGHWEMESGHYGGWTWKDNNFTLAIN